jgi:hypothetical protein
LAKLFDSCSFVMALVVALVAAAVAMLAVRVVA